MSHPPDLSTDSPAAPARSVLDRRDFLKTAALGSGALGILTAATTVAATGNLAQPRLSTALAPADGAAAGSGGIPLAPPDRQPPDLKVPDAVPRKAGWAIVGLGELALGEILPAFLECQQSKPVALVSGHPEKAQKIAALYGIDPKAIYNYANYDDLAKNPAVDIIYIVLPNSMHAEFTVRGLQAGKHVYCEKPMAVTVAESEKMIAAAQQAHRKLGIAYRLHYEPNHLKVMELCRQQTYGKVKVFTSNNCQMTQAPNIRLSRETGGGPVGDVGVYSINAARYCIGEEPVEVSAMAQQPADDPKFREVPESVSYLLRFPSGALASCTCSFGTARSSFYEVVCEKGAIRMDPAFPYQGLRLSVSEDQKKTEMQIPPVNQFTQEIDAFSQSVLENQPVQTPGEEGLADMKIVVAIAEAVKTGGRVKIG